MGTDTNSPRMLRRLVVLLLSMTAPASAVDFPTVDLHLLRSIIFRMRADAIANSVSPPPSTTTNSDSSGDTDGGDEPTRAGGAHPSLASRPWIEYKEDAAP